MKQTLRHSTGFHSRVGRVVAMLLAGVFVALGAAWAADVGSLKILSPAPNAVITGGDVTVEWELAVNAEETHTHVKIDDGRPMVTHKTSRKITGLEPGAHSVTIWVVDHDHQPLGLEERVEFTVK